MRKTTTRFFGSRQSYLSRKDVEGAHGYDGYQTNQDETYGVSYHEIGIAFHIKITQMCEFIFSLLK